ncbi:MAG: hypothetical protein OEY89_15995 [Gammaproteobacteria bacterium]|nr:hypothetical protein [Gammaproteobacteria bacterium]
MKPTNEKLKDVLENGPLAVFLRNRNVKRKKKRKNKKLLKNIDHDKTQESDDA